MNRSTLQALAIPALATFFFFTLTFPIWRWLWQEWMGNDYYSHGLLVPLISLFLAVQRFRHDKSIRNFTASNPAPGLLVLAASVGLFLFFLNAKAYYLAAFTMVVILLGGVWSFTGASLVSTLIFPIGYLVLMVPLPFIERSTLPLAMFTGVCAGNIARFLGLDVTIIGSAVTLPNANLVIGAQCSGVNSLIALTSLMTLAAYLLDGPLWGRLTLALMAIPLAILGNILRVASLLFVARTYGADAAFTYYHDYSGLVFFAGVLLLMFPLTKILQARSFRLEVI
jgi:exosortase